jgi:hypothetical protein
MALNSNLQPTTSTFYGDGDQISTTSLEFGKLIDMYLDAGDRDDEDLDAEDLDVPRSGSSTSIYHDR